MKLSEIEGMTYSEIVRTAEGKIAESDESDRTDEMNAEESLKKRMQEQARAEAIMDSYRGGHSRQVNPMAALAASTQDMAERFHARQQYADFVKAAMQAILTDPIWVNNIEGLAVSACDAAEATLEEMTRRGK